MPLTNTSNRQPCPNCGFDAETPFHMIEVCTLSLPYAGPDGDPRTCTPIYREKFPACRRCDYIIGLPEDDDDEVQKKAIEYGEKIEEITDSVNDLPGTARQQMKKMKG